jgi:hypothetical protein
MKILILILFIPFLIRAQEPISSEVDVQLGAPYLVIDAEDKDYFSLNKERSVAVKTYKNKVFVQVFDTKTAKEIYRNEYNDFPGKIANHEILEMDDKAYYVYSYHDKKTKYHKIAAREIRVNKGTLGSSKTLVSSKGKFFGGNIASFGSPMSEGYKAFKIVKSADESKFLIQYSNYGYLEDVLHNFGIYVFDESLKKVWSKNKMTLPYKRIGGGSILAYTLSNTGTIYSLIRAGGTEPYFEICSIDNTYKITQTKLDFPGTTYPSVVELKEDIDGNIFGAILYEKDVKVIFMGKILVEGFLCFKFNPENELLAEVDTEFSLDFAKQYAPEEKKRSEKKKGRFGIDNLKLIEMRTQEDGSTILVCEQQVTQISFGPNTTTSYYYDNIVLAKFNSDASLAWMKKIPKKQRKGGLLADKSIQYASTEGSHYIFYVDNPKNKKVEADAAPAIYKSGESGFLTLCKIDDATGEYERYTVLDMKNVAGKVVDKFNVHRLYAVDVKEQLFLMECYTKGKRDASIRIKLK